MTPGERAAADQLRAATREVVDGLVSVAADTVANGTVERATDFARDWIRPLLELEPRELHACIVEMIGRLGTQEVARRAALRAFEQLLDERGGDDA